MIPKTWSHPKLHAIASELEVTGSGPALAAGALEWIWHLASVFDPEEGKLPANPYQGSGFSPEKTLKLMIEVGWIDQREGELFVHDWNDWKPAYLKKRSRAKQSAESRKAAQNCAELRRTAPPIDTGTGIDTGFGIGEGEANASPYEPILLAQETIADTTRRIFQACHYRGNRGGQLWRAAAAFHAGRISESDWQGAAESTANNAKRNRPAYFYKALLRRVPDFEQRAATVTITPNSPQIFPGD